MARCRLLRFDEWNWKDWQGAKFVTISWNACWCFSMFLKKQFYHIRRYNVAMYQWIHPLIWSPWHLRWGGHHLEIMSIKDAFWLAIWISVPSNHTQRTVLNDFWLSRQLKEEPLITLKEETSFRHFYPWFCFFGWPTVCDHRCGSEQKSTSKMRDLSFGSDPSWQQHTDAESASLQNLHHSTRWPATTFSMQFWKRPQHT